MPAFRGVCLLVLWLLCLSPPARANSADDVRLTLRVRHTLFSDPELAACNLGVSVRSGAATLIGTVPTSDLVQQALERVRQVKGIRDVRSELVIGNRAEPAPRLRPPTALTSAPQAEPRVPSGEEIVLAIERLRRLDQRYQGLRAELHGKVVILRGNVLRGEDAMDLARIVSRVPGVERVVLEWIGIGR